MGNIHMDARAEQVLDLVVAGLTRAQVIKYVAEKTDWKIKTRQVDRLIARAMPFSNRPPNRTTSANSPRRSAGSICSFAAVCKSTTSKAVWPSRKSASPY